MVVEAGIAGRVEIITNGLLLTPEKSRALVTAGITNINISVQGLDAAGYEETCGIRIDFERYLENLKYLYEHKGNVQIYIKAIDATLKTKENEEKFFEIFSPFADRIYIEHLVVMQQQMDGLREIVDGTKNFYGEELDVNRKVCAQSFYFMQIGCEGDIFPCPVPGLGKNLSMGNAKEHTLMEIWNGSRRRGFLRKMLKKEKDQIPDCATCTCFNAINNPMSSWMMMQNVCCRSLQTRGGTMASEIKPIYGTERVQLASVLPLAAPYSAFVFPTTFCNFKCAYCGHSLGFAEMKKQYDFTPEHMTMETYEKTIEQLAEFPQKLKMLSLTGQGEPLLNPHIADMVRIAKEKMLPSA